MAFAHGSGQIGNQVFADVISEDEAPGQGVVRIRVDPDSNHGCPHERRGHAPEGGI